MADFVLNLALRMGAPLVAGYLGVPDATVVVPVFLFFGWLVWRFRAYRLALVAIIFGFVVFVGYVMPVWHHYTVEMLNTDDVEHDSKGCKYRFRDDKLRAGCREKEVQAIETPFQRANQAVMADWWNLLGVLGTKLELLGQRVVWTILVCVVFLVLVSGYLLPMVSLLRRQGGVKHIVLREQAQKMGMREDAAHMVSGGGD